jgi:hypothetical protein
MILYRGDLAVDTAKYATVGEAARFLGKSRITVMRRLRSGALPSELVCQRGARKVRAIPWEALARAKFGPNAPPVMSEEEAVALAFKGQRSVAAVIRPSGVLNILGRGWSSALFSGTELTSRIPVLEAALQNPELPANLKPAIEASLHVARYITGKPDGDVEGTD